MSKIKELSKLGQSIWYDYIRRSFITSGELKALIDEGLSGETSNPTILEKAIVSSSDYDDDLKRLVKDNKSLDQIYEALVLKDITLAADLFRTVYDSTNGIDGYVSLEMNPNIANNTDSTIAEAKRLFEALNRPNVMIKVPATPAGIPAITELIGSGVNVNVTLIFSLDHYKDTACAYLKGLDTLAGNGPLIRGGHAVDKVASVASFFISRVDTAVDMELEEIGNRELQGKISIANAKLAYAEFKRIYKGSRWRRLAKKGARVQRLLWASTGTKNPAYSDTLYVDELIGPDTINTVPPDTYKNFRDHGTVAITLTKGIKKARAQLASLADVSIDLDVITQKLQDNGLTAFAKSIETLMASIAGKRDHLLAEKRQYLTGPHDFQSIGNNTSMQN